MRGLLVTAGATLIAACSAPDPIDSTFNAQAKAEEQAARERAADARAVRAGFTPDQPAPMETSTVDPPAIARPGIALPASDAKYRYIGRWAASANLCDHGAWKFRSRKLSTAGEASCDLPEVAVVPSGYELTGTCKAEGKETEQKLKISFDERRGTMRVAGRTLGPVDLIYCGD